VSADMEINFAGGGHAPLVPTAFGVFHYPPYGVPPRNAPPMLAKLIVFGGYIPRPLGHKKGMYPPKITLPKQHTTPFMAGLLISVECRSFK